MTARVTSLFSKTFSDGAAKAFFLFVFWGVESGDTGNEPQGLQVATEAVSSRNWSCGSRLEAAGFCFCFFHFFPLVAI